MIICEDCGKTSKYCRCHEDEHERFEEEDDDSDYGYDVDDPRDATIPSYGYPKPEGTW